MSISSIIEKNNFSCIKERLGLEFNLHRHELIVGAIMIGVSLAITVALTGDINEAFARRRRM
jgi:putative exporter of polyketide antibiotics